MGTKEALRTLGLRQIPAPNDEHGIREPLFVRFCAKGGGKFVHFEAVTAECCAVVLARLREAAQYQKPAGGIEPDVAADGLQLEGIEG